MSTEVNIHNISRLQEDALFKLVDEFSKTREVQDILLELLISRLRKGSLRITVKPDADYYVFEEVELPSD